MGSCCVLLTRLLTRFLTCSFLLLLLLISVGAQDNRRYISYTVNLGEGFNLRRDVHMRVANFVRDLRKSTQYDWILVLPPWPRLYHWKSPVTQSWLPWSIFFDIKSLNDYVPTIELTEFVQRKGHLAFEEILALQRLKNAFTNGGEWVEKAVEELCVTEIDKHFFSPDDFPVKKSTCLSVQGRTSVLLSQLTTRASETKSFLILRFEQLMHDQFGSLDYWNARKSMVYAADLRNYGNQFMKSHLNYDPGQGVGRSRPNNGGGEYLSVHLRVQDYKEVKGHLVPSLKGLASQIKALKKEQGLKVVFTASDASVEDKKALKKLIGGKVVWLEPDLDLIQRYGDGGVAIIDQWIAAHARYFVGTTESTFSFRIREDRQFMKFSVESTFNQLCGPKDNQFDPHSCSPPSKWLLVESHDKHREL